MHNIPIPLIRRYFSTLQKFMVGYLEEESKNFLESAHSPLVSLYRTLPGRRNLGSCGVTLQDPPAPGSCAPLPPPAQPSQVPAHSSHLLSAPLLVLLHPLLGLVAHLDLALFRGHLPHKYGGLDTRWTFWIKNLLLL